MGDAKARLTKLEQQRCELEEKIRVARAKTVDQERKADNRRKYLLGAMVLAEMTASESRRREVLAQLDAFLTRDSDRRYFGLSPRPASDVGTAAQ